jgi:flavin-dependent dehydrogenase
VLLVGDAAGYVDALTGEGLAVGFAAARELVRCVAADRPGDYERAWRRVTRRSRALTEALLWASAHQGLRTRLVPASARLPAVFARVVDGLA